jgi:hypothetical protein
VTETGARYTAEIRETDSHGDFLVEKLNALHFAGAPARSVPASTPVLSAPTTVAADSTAPGTPAVGVPLTGQSALVAINVKGRSLTAETNTTDVVYHACPSFQAVSDAGHEIGLAGLRIGDFATMDIATDVPCVRRVSVLAAPQPSDCKAVNYGGGGVVDWIDVNESAKSVVYRATGPHEPAVAVHWCNPPTVVGAHGAAITLASIPRGSEVQIIFSANTWVRSVTVK